MKHLLLFVAMLLCSVTMSAYDLEVDGISYNITSIEDMTVEVTRYQSNDMGYGGYTEDTITIPSTVAFNGNTYSVTAIGAEAFYDCYDLVSITIPESVTLIKSGAFKWCRNLKSLNIPNGVTSIGAEAFENCDGLTSIVIPNSVTSIGGSAFEDCDGLTSIVIPNSVTSIGGSAFEYCDGLTSIVIPNSVTSIGASTFRYCDNLTSAIIGDNVTSIGGSAFSGCRKLTSVTIPENVTVIGEYAFYNTAWYNSLPDGLVYINNVLYKYKGEMATNTSIEVREGTITISPAAFSECKNLTSVTLPESITDIGSAAFSGSGLGSINIPNSVTWINDGTFQDCTNLSSVTIPETVTGIGAGAFLNCKSLSSIIIPKGVVSIDYYAFDGCISLTSISLFSDDLFIPSEAFGGCENLKQLTLDCSRVENWFSGMTSIEEIILGDSVTSIGGSAFSGCSSLSSITIPNSVTSIGGSAFSGCSSLSSITIPNSVTSIGGSAFSDCSSLTSITIPEGVTKIGNDAFQYCSSLTSITIPNSVTMIGYNLFYECNNLKFIRLNTSNVEHWFMDNDAVEEIVLGDSVISIGSGAFSDCSSLTSITIPNSVTSIGEAAFSGCSSLTSITIPNSVTWIGNSSFYQCHNLKSISLNTTTVEPWFNNNGTIEEVVLGDSVRAVEAEAFSGCWSLSSIVVPESVVSVGRNAFEGTVWLNNHPDGIIYINNVLYKFVGEMPDSISIEVKKGTTSITAGAFYNRSNLLSITIPEGVTKIEDSVFYGCSGLTSITIPEGVTEIGDKAFSECSSLKSLTLPSTIQFIGESAFENSCEELTCMAIIPPVVDGWYNSLGSVRLVYVSISNITDYENVRPWNDMTILSILNPIAVHVETAGTMGKEILKHVDYLSHVNDLTVTGVLGKDDIENIRLSMPELVNLDLSKTNITEIPNEMFEEKKKLRSVTLPENLETIGDGAFYNCSNLSEVIMFEGVKAIGERAFARCDLDSISLPNSLEALGSSCFSQCGKLKDVILPTTLKRIPAYAFYYCHSLQNIILPEKLESIGYDAFYDSGLQNITFPEELKYIESGAFSDCNLSSITIPEGCTFIGSGAFGGENLKVITLPSTLVAYNDIFSYAPNFDSLICMALIPPALQSTELPSNSTLFVPALAVNNYKQTPGWASFREILPIEDAYPQSIYVIDEQTLNYSSENIPLEYNPNMYVGYNHSRREYFDDYKDYYDEYEFSIHGALHLKGDATWSLNRLNMSHFLVKHKGYYDEDENWIEGEEISSSLINETTVTADTIVTEVYAKPNEWVFLSFPYDVKVADVLTKGGDWVIRRYDGDARAEADYDHAWATVPYEGVLEAGQGYIWSGTDGYFGAVAMDNENKNRIFAHDTLYTTLNGYSSERATDANWNLIGNPFPSYYDTRFMEYNAPITVWDRENHTYAAYSPIDDSYVLTPFEAFFVQKPGEVETIAFAPEGRQANNMARVVESPSKTRAQGGEHRQVLNFTLSNNDYTDRTRVVINNEAHKAYEAACDAPKFMSSRTNVPQLFTIEADADMAINERPMSDGLVALGTYFGEYGSYTLAMESAATQQVFLVDHWTGVKTDLTCGSYTFTSDAGNYTDRFSLIIGDAADITAINESGIKVDATKNAITVSAAIDVDVEIFNAAGVKVAMDNGKTMTFDVVPGAYIVKVSETSYKVSVK